MAGKHDDKAAKEAKKLMKALLEKLTLNGVAAALGVSEASVRRWAAGSHAPHPGAMTRLRELAEKKTK